MTLSKDGSLYGDHHHPRLAGDDCCAHLETFDTADDANAALSFGAVEAAPTPQLPIDDDPQSGQTPWWGRGEASLQ